MGLKMFAVNRDLRGVGTWGLQADNVSWYSRTCMQVWNAAHLDSMWKLASRSAVRLEVGEDRWTGLELK